MSIATVISRGYGTFAGLRYVPTRGYLIRTTPATPPSGGASGASREGGVKGGTEGDMFATRYNAEHYVNKFFPPETGFLSYNASEDTFSWQGPKVKFTDDGGIAVKLRNKTGADTVKGQIVKADTASDEGVILTAAADTECIGVFLESGTSNNDWAWVVYTGIADVAMEDNTAATAGNWVETSDSEAGYANATSASPKAAPQHFDEIGHCIETVAATGAGTHILAKCIIHFN